MTDVTNFRLCGDCLHCRVAGSSSPWDDYETHECAHPRHQAWAFCLPLTHPETKAGGCLGFELKPPPKVVPRPAPVVRPTTPPTCGCPPNAPCGVPPDPDRMTHFRRTCSRCNRRWLALHCEHDARQMACPHCGALRVVPEPERL